MKVGAVVPAAGRSRRMGREKVLLPFGTSTILETVLEKLGQAGVDTIVVVVKPDLPDAQRRARAAGADVVINPDPDDEMLVSIRLGIERLKRSVDAFFVWPADHPAVAVATLTALVANASAGIVVIPTYRKRRGHPAIVGIDLVGDVDRIPANEGLRWLWRERDETVRELAVDDPGVLENLDDPATYETARRREQASDRSRSDSGGKPE